MSILRFMLKKKVLIFGATGQIGRHLIRKLTKNDYKVICQTRNTHKAVFLKTSGSLGYIDIVEANIFDEDNLEKLIENCDICINLIGILFEQKKFNTFKNIHTIFPIKIAKICEKKKVQFIHFSALGLDKAKDSKYAKSKIDGELGIKENNDRSVIVKPSLVFSVSDSLTTKFLSILNNVPVFPLYYSGLTKFTPIHASDVSDLVYEIIIKEIHSKSIEAIGPEVLTFKQIIEILLECIDKKRLLIPLPLTIAKLSASVLQMLPNPLITLDQLRLLKYDNIKSENGITNFELGHESKINFKDGVMKYAYNWRDGGQYSIRK